MDQNPQQILHIPPLLSGGVMLSYHCSNACRHCLYRCSPRQPDAWISPGMLAEVMKALAAEPRLDGIHISGGEPLLRPELAEEAVRQAVAHGVHIDYIETNAGWCEDVETGRAVFKKLRQAGLTSVLISVSPFHAEFIPFSRTRACIAAAAEVFGPGEVIIYQQHIHRILARMGDGIHKLREFCAAIGIPEDSVRLPELYGVIPSGRAPRGLRHNYKTRPAIAFVAERCRHELLMTTHFHIDPLGTLFTGGCAGMAPATIENLHPEITRFTHPVFHQLCQEGPCALMYMARLRYGFIDRAEGYVSKCDLCFDVRRHLAETGAYPELRPMEFYELA